MKKPGRLVVATVAMPLLAGCFTVQPMPLPANATARENVEVRGVVLGATQERVEFKDVLETQWGPDALSVVGTPSDAADGVVETRLFPLTSIESLLVKQVDAGTTSAIIGVALVGVLAVWARWVTGRNDEYTSLPGFAPGG